MEPLPPGDESQRDETMTSWRDPRKPLWGNRAVVAPEEPTYRARARLDGGSVITGIDVPFGDVFWIVVKVMIAQALVGVIMLIVGMFFWIVAGAAMWSAIN